MRRLFDAVFAWRHRHRWLLVALAVALTIVFAFVDTAPAAWPPWWSLVLAAAVLVLTLGALEPALVVLGVPALGACWAGAADARWSAAGLAAGVMLAYLVAAARLARFRGRSAAVPANVGGALLIAIVLLVAASAEPATALPALAAFLLAPLGMDILLFRDNERTTPRLPHLLGGAYVGLFLLLLQLALAVAGQILRVWPGDRLARVRRLGRLGMRGMIRAFPYGRCEWIGATPEAFGGGALVISNHQSAADIPVVLALPADIRLTVNARVWNDPWLGITARKLGHVLVEADQADTTLAQCRRVLEEGALVHFFPEGTRSTDIYPRRFHRGAFEAAVALGCDIVPVVLCDTRSAVPRDAFWVAGHHASVRVLPPITPDTFDYGRGSRDLMKHAQELVRGAFVEELARINTPAVLRGKIARCYHYQGRKATRAVRRTLRRDPLLSALGGLPGEGTVLDLGCGYGVSAHWLTECHPRLVVVGVDRAPDRIRVARRSAAGRKRLSFVEADFDRFELPAADGVVVREGDAALFARIAACLSPGGRLLVRSADPAVVERAGFEARGGGHYERGESA
ncbi:MAG: 1-acyl-sn-glycerol-3-phosphate acyltransferase [Planctomycetota bacterium]